MSANMYDLCCRYRGKHVRIWDKRGGVHSGRIVHVTRNKVYIQPFMKRNPGGFGFGYYGGYYGGFFGAPFAISLAFIAGIALGGLFFW